MSDNFVLDPNSEDNKIQPVVTSRGDSFDLGSSNPAQITQSPEIIRVLQDPSQLAALLGVSVAQAENIRAVLVGGGAALSTKYLSKHFGSAVAGALGGFMAGLIADKVFDPKKKQMGRRDY